MHDCPGPIQQTPQRLQQVKLYLDFSPAANHFLIQRQNSRHRYRHFCQFIGSHPRLLHHLSNRQAWVFTKPQHLSPSLPPLRWQLDQEPRIPEVVKARPLDQQKPSIASSAKSLMLAVPNTRISSDGLRSGLGLERLAFEPHLVQHNSGREPVWRTWKKRCG